MVFKEKTLESELIYDGQILRVRRDKVTTKNGTSYREIVEHNGASCVVALDDDYNIVMVTQYRKAIESELLELPAGKLDKGEDPLHAAKRELKEETGISADKFEHLATLLPAVGYSGEKLEIYLARGLHCGDDNPDEDEDLEVKKINIDKLVDMIFEGEIVDSKTMVGILMVNQMISKGEI